MVDINNKRKNIITESENILNIISDSDEVDINNIEYNTQFINIIKQDPILGLNIEDIVSSLSNHGCSGPQSEIIVTGYLINSITKLIKNNGWSILDICKEEYNTIGNTNHCIDIRLHKILYTNKDYNIKPYSYVINSANLNRAQLKNLRGLLDEYIRYKVMSSFLIDVKDLFDGYDITTNNKIINKKINKEISGLSDSIDLILDKYVIKCVRNSIKQGFNDVPLYVRIVTYMSDLIKSQNVIIQSRFECIKLLRLDPNNEYIGMNYIYHILNDELLYVIDELETILQNPNTLPSINTNNALSPSCTYQYITYLSKSKNIEEKIISYLHLNKTITTMYSIPNMSNEITFDMIAQLLHKNSLLSSLCVPLNSLFDNNFRLINNFKLSSSNDNSNNKSVKQKHSFSMISKIIYSYIRNRSLRAIGIKKTQWFDIDSLMFDVPNEYDIMVINEFESSFGFDVDVNIDYFVDNELPMSCIFDEIFNVLTKDIILHDLGDPDTWTKEVRDDLIVKCKELNIPYKKIEIVITGGIMSQIASVFIDPLGKYKPKSSNEKSKSPNEDTESKNTLKTRNDLIKVNDIDVMCSEDDLETAKTYLSVYLKTWSFENKMKPDGTVSRYIYSNNSFDFTIDLFCPSQEQLDMMTVSNNARSNIIHNYHNINDDVDDMNNEVDNIKSMIKRSLDCENISKNNTNTKSNVQDVFMKSNVQDVFTVLDHISLFHFPAVRAYKKGNKIFCTPDYILSTLSGKLFDLMFVNTASHTPEDIFSKYKSRYYSPDRLFFNKSLIIGDTEQFTISDYLELIKVCDKSDLKD